MNINPLLLIDGYKLDHRRQYPPGTSLVYSNWTPRTSRVPEDTSVVFFGLQYFLKEYLGARFHRDFFSRPLPEVLKEYHEFVDSYLGPNSIDLSHIEALHKLGYLPLEFRALPEGSAVPLGVPALTVQNTLPEFFWLTNYIETPLSNVLWKPCTSATTARGMRRIIEYYADATGADKGFIDWQGHDFSYRGMSGLEDACLSGAGHLLFFTGTDTIPAIEFLKRYYPPVGNGIIGGSVAATEHSVVCAGGEGNELETLGRLLDLYPSGVLSYVSDTWNLWDLLTQTLPQLQGKIMARNGKLVIRPDSGDPVKIICGDPDAEKFSPAWYGVVKLLWTLFGGTSTAGGYRTLDSHIGVIYGDSISRERADSILTKLEEAGFASDNIVFGIGSYTYEYVTRDTYGFAMKATYAEIDGEGKNLHKKPVTDSGGKFSAKGKLSVIRNERGGLTLINCATPEQMDKSELKLVWKDGIFREWFCLEEVRARARKEMWK